MTVQSQQLGKLKRLKWGIFTHSPRRQPSAAERRLRSFGVLRVLPQKLIRVLQHSEFSKKAGSHVLEAYANELGS